MDSNFVTAAATDDQALKKRFIRFACFVVISGCLAYLALAPWLAGQLPMHFIAPALFLLVCLSALALLDRLGTQATGLLISYGMCAGSLLAGTLSGTVRTTSIYSLIVVIGMAGWLAGPRHALQVAALSIAGTLGITLAGLSGLLPDTSPPRPYAIWFGLAILLTIAAILSRMVTLAFQAQLARVERLSKILERQVREIKADETQLRLVAENMPAMVVHVRQRRCIYANSQYAAFIGKAQKDVVGLHISELIGESAHADISPFLERAEAGERVVYRRIAQRPDGEELAIEVSLVPERIEGGEVVGTIGLVQDITEQLRRETALRLSEDKFSKVFSANPLAIAITRLSDGRYLEINDAWSRLHGWSREEAIGRTSFELGTWIDPQQRESWKRTMLESGRVSNLDVHFGFKDGTRREVLLSAELIELDGQQCALVMASDMTERKQAEEAQRESQERFAKIFQASPITILITRKDTGQYLNVNDTFTRQFGWSRQEVLGRTSIDIGIWKTNEDRARWVAELDRRGTVRDYEVGLLTKSGELRHTIVSAETIEIGGMPCIISLVYDITERKQAEDALRQSEERFTLMFRSSPEAVTISSEADGRYLDVNDAFTRLFGWTREESIGRTALELGLWADPRDRTRWIDAIGPTGSARDFEALFVTKSGERRQVLVSAGVLDLSGERWILSFCYDITERKRTEEALRRSEDKFSRVFQVSPIAISLARFSDGAFADVNPAFTRVFGWAREELVGRTSTAVGLWPSDDERMRWLEALKSAGQTHDFVVRWHNKAGEPLICQISAEVVQIGGESYILAMISDVTDRVRAEEALKTSQARLTEVQRIGHIGSWELDLATRRLYWTEELFKIYECDPASFGGTWDDLLSRVHPEDLPVINKGFKESAKITGTYELDHRIITPAGRVKHLHVSWEVFLDDGGKPIRALGTAQDITEQVLAKAEINRLNAELEQRVQERTAELTAANRELESFAYSISHDLRAPLRGIDGFSKLLTDEYRERLDEQGIDYLDRVRRAAQRMGTLIDDILELSRVTRQEMRRVRVDLSQIAAEVIEERSRAEPSHRVAVTLAPDCTTHGDPQLLRVLMQNLLENAWKYSAKKADPAIEFGRETIDGESVFFVRDNGVGFDMKYADRLFTPFQRLHRPEEFEGTGIGLATVARIVRRHGGRVWAESEPGKGTIVRLTLPWA